MNQELIPLLAAMGAYVVIAGTLVWFLVLRDKSQTTKRDKKNKRK